MGKGSILTEILQERERQIEIQIGGDTNAFDETNSANDWVSYIVAYAGRASSKVHRNERDGQSFRDNMIKVGALVVAAIEAYDNGFFD